MTFRGLWPRRVGESGGMPPTPQKILTSGSPEMRFAAFWSPKSGAKDPKIKSYKNRSLYSFSCMYFTVTTYWNMIVLPAARFLSAIKSKIIWTEKPEDNLSPVFFFCSFNLADSRSCCWSNRPFALRGHVTSFLWKWKLYDFAFKKPLVGHILNKIIVI